LTLTIDEDSKLNVVNEQHEIELDGNITDIFWILNGDANCVGGRK